MYNIFTYIYVNNLVKKLITEVNKYMIDYQLMFTYIITFTKQRQIDRGEKAACKTDNYDGKRNNKY